MRKISPPDLSIPGVDLRLFGPRHFPPPRTNPTEKPAYATDLFSDRLFFSSCVGSNMRVGAHRERGSASPQWRSGIEPPTGSGADPLVRESGGFPSAPWSWKPFSFWTSDERAKFAILTVSGKLGICTIVHTASESSFQSLYMNSNFVAIYTVFQKKFTPRTFMITVWNENQFKLYLAEMYLTKFATKLYATDVRLIRWASLLQVSKWDSIFFQFNNGTIENRDSDSFCDRNMSCFYQVLHHRPITCMTGLC